MGRGSRDSKRRRGTGMREFFNKKINLHPPPIIIEWLKNINFKIKK